MSDSREQVLDVAEQLFLERGYAGTRLRDIADALGIKHASLYHHAPKGKKELWNRVLDRTFDRHHQALEDARNAAPTLRAQLIAMANWLVSQPKMNIVAVASADAPRSPQPDAHAIAARMEQSIVAPITQAFREARENGILREQSPDLLAGMFVSSVNGLITASSLGQVPLDAQQVVPMLVDVLLEGALPRP